MTTSDDIAKIALEKLALDLLKELPDQDLRKYISKAIADKVSSVLSDYSVSRAIEEAVAKKTTQLLATPEYQKQLETVTRKGLSEVLPLYEQAVAATFLEAFGTKNNQSYQETKVYQQFLRVITEAAEEKEKPVKGRGRK